MGAWRISASGLSAQWNRMRVIASNVAHADTTRTPGGGAYRKHYPVFSAMLDEVSGVQYEGSREAREAARTVHAPDDPRAGEDGKVTEPNVSLPLQSRDMVSARRAYQANMRAMKQFKKLCQKSLNLRG